MIQEHSIATVKPRQRRVVHYNGLPLSNHGSNIFFIIIILKRNCENIIICSEQYLLKQTPQEVFGNRLNYATVAALFAVNKKY